jgi:diacylglycerol kinase family enzyme
VRLFTNTLDGSPSVQRLRGGHFIIERTAPGRLHTDGETHDTTASVEVTVLPRSLKIMGPAKPIKPNGSVPAGEDCVTFSPRP